MPGLWKDYIDLKKPENFAVLAQFFNQGNDENPHKFPIIDYWGYAMKARTLLYEILNKHDTKGFSVSKYPPAPEDFIIVKFKKVDDKTEDRILPNYKEVPKTYPGKPDTFENFIKRINKKINEIINSINDFISLNQT